MKTKIKNILLFIIPVLLTGVLISSCNEEESTGNPDVGYIRVTDPAKSDSLLVGAFLGNTIAIVGENLGNVVEVWFNDQEAILNPVYITNSAIITNVPNKAPVEITDKMYLVLRNGTVYEHAFKVNIPPPVILAMSNEYASDGEDVTITGQYFFDPTPITVDFQGANGPISVEAFNVTASSLEVTVPPGAASGPITMTTNFGEVVSGLHFRDHRNIILNYDDKTAGGSWRPGLLGSVDGIDGKYLILRGILEKNQRREDYPDGGFVSQFWGNSRLPEGNFFEGNIEDFEFKFEVKVVDWYGSYLNICWGPWNNQGNQEYWANLNARGLWRPWEAANSNYNTGGKWITVTIPMTEMKWEQQAPEDVEYSDMKFDKNIAGTLTFWVVGTPLANASPVEIYIDNVRVVEK